MQSTIDILSKLVSFDTTSRNSNIALIEWISEMLEGVGASIRLTHNIDGTKANLLASFGPEVDGGVILSGHTDVVPVDGQDWSSDPFVLTERSGRLYGRGASDMKGFIASCLAAAAQWGRRPLQRPIYLAFSYDEEVGCVGAPALIDDMTTHLPRAALAIIGEPTDMMLGMSHAGVNGSFTSFKGVAAHASDPTRGANAIKAASRFIQHLASIEDRVAAADALATINVGQIVGGTAINIVAERCDVRWEYRPANLEAEEFVRHLVDTYLRDASQGDVSIASRQDIAVPQFRSGLGEEMIQVVHACGARSHRTTLPFGSEAGLFERAGVPSIVCGPGSIDQAHRPDEWIEISALEEADRFIAGVGAWAASTPP